MNITLSKKMTDEIAANIPLKYEGNMIRVIFKVIYAIGIIGNATAIIALRKGEHRIRNKKHLLLLTSLAANDLVALVGMMCAMIVSEQYPEINKTRLFCAARVVLRIFGIGSVCIAVTMALERYLALTRPFLYQQQITYYMIRTALLISWLWAGILTCAPIFGLGLYYDEQQHICTRYRNAITNTDFGYAIIYVLFGIFLCVILVYCNLAVIKALYAISAPRPGGQPVLPLRRVSKKSCRNRQRSFNTDSNLPMYDNAATAEEVAFSRLMATLSVLFMICWLPQMITSALHLALDQSRWHNLNTLAALSDMLMLLNYVLDPILYVLMRQHRRISPITLCQSLVHCFERKHKTSTESCCQQDTIVVVSDSFAAELRPLRALHAPTSTSSAT